MELIKSNFINTTTQLAVDSNTLASKNIFNRDLVFQYVSDGFADDLTTTSLIVTFDTATSIDRIAILGHNLKSYDIFFDGVTANTFSFTTASSTITSQFSTNSETSQYFFTTPQTVTSITIDMKETISADVEKAIGLLVLSEQRLDFERIASAKNYRPTVDSKQVIHKLSDGGVRLHQIADKFKARIKYKHITEQFRNDLKSVFDDHVPVIFVPFGTATSWDLVFFDAIWEKDFDFFKFSDNAVGSGFSGTINLTETTN